MEVGRCAQVGKTSLLEVNLYGTSVDVEHVIFYLVRFRPWDPTKTLDLWKKTKHFFTMQSQDSGTTALQQSGVVSQQRLRPRVFDSTVKRVPKLSFEPVSFLLLACF